MIKKYKKQIIIISIIIIIILLIIALIPRVQKKAMEIAKYDSVQDIPSIEAAVRLMQCDYIKEEHSTSNGYDIDIYLKFDKPLYSGEESNENYYSVVTQLVAEVTNFKNFRLIDEQKETTVAVLCKDGEIQRVIINGYTNYYSMMESLDNLKNYTRPKITTLEIQSDLLKTLINNNWNIKSLELETPEESDEENYDLYPYTGIEIRRMNNNQVFNILFELNYGENVVNNLNINSTLEEVIQTLGEPTFGSVEEQTIGYMSNEIYVFFSEDAISVYKVEQYETNEFEAEIEKYEKNKNLKTHISNITDIWPDYDNYYYDSNTVDLSYILKGIKVQYGISYNHGITIYTNYKGKIRGKEIEELTQEEIPYEVYFENKDSVAEYEQNRAFQHRLFYYDRDDDE